MKDINNAINPEHYNRLDPQPKDVIRQWGLNFNLGSAVKYISRAGHKDDIVQDLKKAQEFIQFEIDAIEAQRKQEPKRCKEGESYEKHLRDVLMDNMYLACKSSIEITGNRNGKTDEEISKIVNNTLKDIISGMAGVELVDIEEGKSYTEVHIASNRNHKEIMDYINKELNDL